MSSTQRTFTVALWFLVVASLLGLLAMQRWASKQESSGPNTPAIEVIELNPDRPATVTNTREPLNIPAPSFSMIDQDGTPFDSAMLKGKIWTFSLFFSECQGVCPTMRKKFEAVQSTTDNPDVHFILMSVDPEKDTPEKLATYARAAKADGSRSHLLTGDLKEIQRVAMEFLIPFDLPVNHSSKVMLIDREGIVRSFYTGTDEAEMKRLAADVKKLVEKAN